jgi:N-glycosidase YbiA
VITQFQGQFRCFSNFYPSPIEMEGRVYPSVENAYQAAKTLDHNERAAMTSMTAGQSKRAGRAVRLRSDWETIKIAVMLNLLRVKFQYPDLRAVLLSTGSLELQEGNTWNDRFWGVCPPGSGQGENWLGRLLMQVRSELDR